MYNICIYICISYILLIEFKIFIIYFTLLLEVTPRVLSIKHNIIHITYVHLFHYLFESVTHKVNITFSAAKSLTATIVMQLFSETPVIFFFCSRRVLENHELKA